MPPREQSWCPQASGTFPNWVYFFALTSPGIPKCQVFRHEVPVLLSKMHRHISGLLFRPKFFHRGRMTKVGPVMSCEPSTTLKSGGFLVAEASHLYSKTCSRSVGKRRNTRPSVTPGTI